MSSHSWDVLARLPRQPPADMIILAEARRPGDPAASPAPSASVILVRDGATGLETYLLHRHARMPFAASAVVFPGGRVDAVDVAGGGDPARACALRETAEETGVALTFDDLVPWAHWITPSRSRGAMTRASSWPRYRTGSKRRMCRAKRTTPAGKCRHRRWPPPIEVISRLCHQPARSSSNWRTRAAFGSCSTRRRTG